MNLWADPGLSLAIQLIWWFGLARKVLEILTLRLADGGFRNLVGFFYGIENNSSILDFAQLILKVLHSAWFILNFDLLVFECTQERSDLFQYHGDLP